MINIQEKQDLNAWPSDCFEKEKFNVVEFYHKILWASQHQQQEYQRYEDQNKIAWKRVTFSLDPPEIYEYEPEYTKATTSFFPDYFKRKFHNLENEQYSTRKIQQQSSIPLDEKNFKDVTIVRVRSITDFNPVPNQQYNQQQQQQQVPSYYESMQAFDSSFMHIDMSFEREQQEEMYAVSCSSSAVMDESIISSPPPSYNEECVIKRKMSLTSGLKRRISMKFWSSNSNDTGGNSSSCSNTTEEKGLVRTLRKIKSSPRLMIQRRASVVSLRKKASFLGA
jgi:hypothetical protein